MGQAVLAQEVDSLAVDSVVIVPDSVALGPVEPVGPFRALFGPVPDTTRPALTRHASLPAYLADGAAPFGFTTGQYVWPEVWAPFGLTPRYAQVRLEGLLFDDLIDGRPMYELLPLEALDAPVVTLGTVQTSVSAFRGGPPLTEFRYRQGGGGYRSISALHVQERQRTLFGRPGRVNLLFRYAGAGADNAFVDAGANTRQLTGRLRYEQPGYVAELLNAFAQWDGASNGGYTVSSGRAFAAVYDPLSAVAVRPDARRTVKRNDLLFRLRLRTFGALEPTEAGVFWTTQSRRFVESGDSLRTRAWRVGAFIDQPVHPLLTFRAEVYRDQLGTNTVIQSDVPTREVLRVAARGEWTSGTLRTEYEASVSQIDAQSVFDGRLRAETRSFFVDARQAGRVGSWIDQYGYGLALTVAEPGPTVQSRFAQAEAGYRARRGAFDVVFAGFVSRIEDPERYLESDPTDAESTSRFVLADALADQVAGLRIRLGWRLQSARGLYATAEPVYAHAETSDAAFSTWLPEWSVRGRLGARGRAFGQLNLDASIGGRAWSAYAGRVLHPETGLLVVPDASAVEVPAGGVLDLRVEALLQGATLFIAYENALSTLAYDGAFDLPVYPLPAGDLRFGIHWPILN